MRRIFGHDQPSKSSSRRNSRASMESRQRLSSPPLSVNKEEEEEDENTNLLHGRYPYCKLPRQKVLELSVLKLDGSLFDVCIGRNSTVAELKRAVEEVFVSSSSREEGQEKISWSHVWGHFCLCYEGKKLINDKVCIRNFGIKDGDQLQFSRHISLNYSHSKGRSKKQNVASIPVSANENYQGYNSMCHHQYDPDLEQNIRAAEFKLAHFLKGLLSHSRLWGASRKGSEGKNRVSRFGMQSLESLGGNERRTIQLQG